MVASRRVNGGIGKGQWGHWRGSMGALNRVNGDNGHVNALIHFKKLINVSMIFTNLKSIKGLGAGFK